MTLRLHLACVCDAMAAIQSDRNARMFTTCAHPPGIKYDVGDAVLVSKSNAEKKNVD